MNKKHIRLIDFDNNRRNNFTLIRIVFAWLVLYGHGYAIEKSHGIRDPLNTIFQGSIWIGAIAVNGFFVISGFLVAASFVKRGLFNYLISRFLRIYPALIVCVLISVFVLGPFLTNMDTIEYFKTSKTYNYLLNALAFLRMHWDLPGVFANNTRTAINGSLWTLTVEVRCYLILAFIGILGVLRKSLLSNIVILVIFVFALFFFNEISFFAKNEKWARLALYFLIGVFFYINRAKIILDGRVGMICLILIVFSFGKPWFQYTFPLAFSYVVFCMAYRTYYLNIEKICGDLSYGIYIYAWPVQQTVAQISPALGPAGNTIISTLIVIGIAYISWHYIENPALSLKHKLLNGDKFVIAAINLPLIRSVTGFMNRAAGRFSPLSPPPPRMQDLSRDGRVCKKVRDNTGQ